MLVSEVVEKIGSGRAEFGVVEECPQARELCSFVVEHDVVDNSREFHFLVTHHDVDSKKRDDLIADDNWRGSDRKGQVGDVFVEELSDGLSTNIDRRADGVFLPGIIGEAIEPGFALLIGHSGAVALEKRQDIGAGWHRNSLLRWSGSARSTAERRTAIGSRTLRRQGATCPNVRSQAPVDTYTPEFVEIADESPEALFALLESRGLGDGLPVVAPTRARVEAMLEFAAGDPDEVLFTLQPRSGIVTRRVVAINAVMAGCTPAVFPVVLSALRALSRPEVNLRGVNATTHLVAPMIIVHGEIVKTAGFNAGVGAFGPGNRANATVGRAVRLVLFHVAGAKPGFGDAATHGQPAKYTFCAAENLDATPWESYPISRGIDAPSAVTVHCGEGPHNVHDAEADGDPSLILDKIASAMTSLGQNNAPISQAEYFIVLGPEHAASLAQRALTRRDVANYLSNSARMPAWVFRKHFQELAWANWMKIVDDEELLPMTGDADNIRVLVSGGPGKHSLVIPSWGMTRSATVPVEG